MTGSVTPRAAVDTDMLRPISNEGETWSWPRLLAVRFGIVFGALSILPFPLDLVPGLRSWPDDLFNDAWSWLADAFSRHVLGTGAVEVVQTGSGDTKLAYVQLALTVLLAVLGTVAWSLADRRRRAYPRLAAAARIVLRYWLASVMLGYGLDKVLALQFPAPGPIRLYEPIGHLTPMGMLWTFMGSSTPYQVFGGTMECLGGALLLWRRTTTLGALVLVPVLANVVMLNFCYDVPVKLFSSELLAAAIVLAWPDVRRIGSVVLGGAAEAVASAPRWPGRWRFVRAGAKLAIIGWIAYQQIDAQLEMRAHTSDLGGALAGAWQVERFERDGAEVPPLATDPMRWKLVLVESYGFADIRTMTDVDRYARLDGTRLQLGEVGALDLTREGADRVRLAGELAGHRLAIELRRAEGEAMPLVDTGFHWIQEFPNNR